MKTMFLIVVFATVAAAFPIHPVKKQDFGDVFRSDTTLRFMRGSSRQGPLTQAQQGPNADSKEAQKAAANVADEQKAAEKAAPKEPNPIQQAGEAVSDAVSDGMKDAQQGPNADSKKAQKAADNVADEQKAQEKAAPKETNPLEQAGKAVADGVKAVGDTLSGAEKADGEKTSGAEAAAEEPEDKEVPSEPGCKNFPKGWADKKGNDCEDYAEGQWCNRHGGYGDAWLDDWGKFEDVANKGKTALQVCCVCGGGQRKEAEAGAPGGAPSAAPAAAASPAGAPVPAITGPILGTKAGRPLQAPGYSGDAVMHEDQKTMTDDWGQEFGPQAGHRDIKTICQDHPGNEWCSLHGYYDKSGTSPLNAMAALLASALLAFLW